MIEAEVREAYQRSQQLAKLDYPSAFQSLLNCAWGSYVEAEWQRRKAGFIVDSYFHQCMGREQCELIQHRWTDAQWREEVLAELMDATPPLPSSSSAAK